MHNSRLKWECWCQWHEYSALLPVIRDVVGEGSEWATDIVKAVRSVTNSASGTRGVSHMSVGTLTWYWAHKSSCEAFLKVHAACSWWRIPKSFLLIRNSTHDKSPKTEFGTRQLYNRKIEKPIIMTGFTWHASISRERKLKPATTKLPLAQSIVGYVFLPNIFLTLTATHRCAVFPGER
jgi:hypothetical protein